MTQPLKPTTYRLFWHHDLTVTAPTARPIPWLRWLASVVFRKPLSGWVLTDEADQQIGLHLGSFDKGDHPHVAHGWAYGLIDVGLEKVHVSWRERPRSSPNYRWWVGTVTPAGATTSNGLPEWMAVELAGRREDAIARANAAVHNGDLRGAVLTLLDHLDVPSARNVAGRLRAAERVRPT